MNKFPCEPRHLITRDQKEFGMLTVELCCTMHGKLGEFDVREHHMLYEGSPALEAAKDRLRDLWENHVSPKIESNPLRLPTYLL